MRVGIVSPYSLTLPGGVQCQVLGLARALRALGHPTRVLGPCDGPPPDAPFDGLEVLLPARDYKNRHASILLSLEALSEAMAQAAQSDCA